MNLEYAAAQFLKVEKRCALVLMERSPRTWMAGQPDVLGVTDSRYLLEIEVKRSLSDFRQNEKKLHLQRRFCLEDSLRARYAQMAPRQFWFMVPPHLVEKIQAELPQWAGLITLNENGVTCDAVRGAPINPESLRLSLKECAKLMRCAGNMVIALMRENDHRRSKGDPRDCNVLDDIYSKPIWPYDKPSDYSNFQI